jgi:2-iminoacetate synthase
MSVASRTTVGGYHEETTAGTGQFEVNDTRSVDAFCAMLRGRGLEPVFKNWDGVFQAPAA